MYGEHWHTLDPLLQRCLCGVKGPSANHTFTTWQEWGDVLTWARKQPWFDEFEYHMEDRFRSQDMNGLELSLIGYEVDNLMPLLADWMMEREEKK